MIIEERLNNNLIRRYSDNPDMELLQLDTGLRYSEAIDSVDSTHTYSEVPIYKPQPEEEEEPEE